ncbi:ATP-grasp fold amidoligase family protein [Chengkuizengella axinellae]|uniref:ATP-grasp fold amidoligase family protein n=1 Tax=Chengkuizengella axinellae TaxID=3064388 RepID=A0ABT9IZH0_9BACL|nr:ATP-grasp fold amidoligase family protein [Chengkuizengella sp. 2205SS18-9]MDP5274722.1 ATP-grasp fold amidoligase family protein [Chengkuizengella sp. 2205SS18-9]
MKELRPIFFRFIKVPLKVFKHMGGSGLLNWLSDEFYLKLVYWCETGKKLNTANPSTFNEKLQWLKLHDRKPEYTRYVDKYEVRSYIKQSIGEQYLIPHIGIYNTVEEIDWNALPNQFVLKCTHSSGRNIICTNKDRLDIKESKRKLNKWLKRNHYWYGREWPYKNIKARITCEEFISDTGKAPDDYKVLCFNGTVKLIQVHTNRFANHKQDFYDRNWRRTQISQEGSTSNTLLERPEHLNKMIQLSEKLASNMRHVRIDWFVVQGQLFFGEITFFDGSGFVEFDNHEDDHLLGSWIELTGY